MRNGSRVTNERDERDESDERLDKWLWFTRFYKTRGLATAAIAGGKVHLNGERVKPAHRIRPGDQVSVTFYRGRKKLIVKLTLGDAKEVNT